MFLLSPKADMHPADLQARVLKFRGQAFWFADREAIYRLTNGSPANLRLRRTGRTRIIAESQGNEYFSLADSQSWFCSVVGIAGTNSGTQLAHYFVRGYGFAVELGCSLSLPRSAFPDTYLAVETGMALAEPLVRQ